MSQVTHLNATNHTPEWVFSQNESCNLYECVMSRIWMTHVTHLNESSTHTYTHTHTHTRTHMEVGMKHSCVRHVCDMTHARVRHDRFTSAIWPIHTGNVVHLQMQEGTLRDVARQWKDAHFESYPQICMRHISQMNDSHHTCEFVL